MRVRTLSKFQFQPNLGFHLGWDSRLFATYSEKKEKISFLTIYSIPRTGRPRSSLPLKFSHARMLIGLTILTGSISAEIFKRAACIKKSATLDSGLSGAPWCCAIRWPRNLNTLIDTEGGAGIKTALRTNRSLDGIRNNIFSFHSGGNLN